MLSKAWRWILIGFAVFMSMAFGIEIRRRKQAQDAQKTIDEGNDKDHKLDVSQAIDRANLAELKRKIDNPLRAGRTQAEVLAELKRRKLID